MTDLQQAVELIKAGEKPEARRIVLQELRLDEDNIKAWLCLTRCAANREQFEISVRNVLRLDPENAYARKLAVRYDVDLYSDLADILQAEREEDEKVRKAKEVDDALEHINDVLDPVQPARRRTIRQREREANLPDAFMSPARKWFLRVVRLVGVVALVGIIGVLGLTYANSREDDLSVAEQETRNALDIAAQTAYYENTLSVATVVVRATVFAGTETAIAVENTIIVEAEVVYLRPDRIERTTVFAPDEAIGIRFVAGSQADPNTTLSLRVVDAQSGAVAQMMSIRLGEGRRSVRIMSPETGWQPGNYVVELAIEDSVLLRLNAEVAAAE